MMPNAQHRQEKASQVNDAIRRINSGEILNVCSASYSSLGICIGDFRENYWSCRQNDNRSMWYRWNGPVAIIVDGVLVNPGDDTAHDEMDWS